MSQLVTVAALGLTAQAYWRCPPGGGRGWRWPGSPAPSEGAPLAPAVEWVWGGQPSPPSCLPFAPHTLADGFWGVCLGMKLLGGGRWGGLRLGEDGASSGEMSELQLGVLWGDSDPFLCSRMGRGALRVEVTDPAGNCPLPSSLCCCRPPTPTQALAL